MTPTPAPPTRSRPLGRTRTLASLATLLLALGSSASAQQTETFTGVITMQGKPVFPQDVIPHENGNVTVHESAVTIETLQRRSGDRLVYTFTGSGRLLYTFTQYDANGDTDCMDTVARTIDLEGVVSPASAASANGVQMPFLSGFLRYRDEVSKGDTRRQCLHPKSGLFQAGIDGLLTNERGFQATAGGRSLEERFLAIYHDGGSTSAGDRERRLRLDPADWGTGLMAVLSSSTDFVEGDYMRSIHPVVRRLDASDGQLAILVKSDGMVGPANLGDEIEPGDRIVVWGNGMAVLRFQDGSAVTVRAASPARRVGPGDYVVPPRNGIPGRVRSTASTYGIFYNKPTTSQRVRTFVQSGSDTTYKIGRGLFRFLFPPPSRGRFEAETNSVATGVEGTIFRVIDREGTTTVQVQEGAVEVRPRAPGAPPFSLQAGRQVTVDARGAGPTETYLPSSDDRRIVALLEAYARDPSGGVADGGPGAVPGGNEPAPPTGGSKAGSLPGVWRIELVPLRGVRRAGRAELAGEAGSGHVTIVWDDGGTSTGYLGESRSDLTITLPYDRPTYPRSLTGRMDTSGQRLSGAILDSEDRQTGTWTATRKD